MSEQRPSQHRLPSTLLCRPGQQQPLLHRRQVRTGANQSWHFCIPSVHPNPLPVLRTHCVCQPKACDMVCLAGGTRACATVKCFRPLWSPPFSTRLPQATLGLRTTQCGIFVPQCMCCVCVLQVAFCPTMYVCAWTSAVGWYLSRHFPMLFLLLLSLRWCDYVLPVPLIPTATAVMSTMLDQATTWRFTARTVCVSP